MKNSKEYSQRIRKLFNSLKRKYRKIQNVTYDDPVEAVVHAIVSENMTEKSAKSVMKKIKEYFVDLNDLRVSRIEEIVEVLGEDNKLAKDTASTIVNALRVIFNKYNNISLRPLQKTGKRQAEKFLEKLEGLSRFVIDYTMLTSLQSHTIALTGTMLKYLRDKELVAPEADESEIHGFLARQISAKDAYRFYALLRHESESKNTGKTAAKKSKTTKILETEQQEETENK